MSPSPPTFILRHRKENLKKCSLEGMEKREETQFFTYPKDALPFVPNTILLKCHAPILTLLDTRKPLLILDGSWKYAARMEKYVYHLGPWEARSLPPQYKTAYPRKPIYAGIKIIPINEKKPIKNFIIPL